jgi:alpha-glucan,water dikinase
MTLNCPAAAKTEIWPVLQSINVDNWNEAWETIKRVWGSKFNERALLSTKKAGITLADIFMSVLVQEVVPAEYAFVIHTTNPMSGDSDELYAEVVLGMGETLVGAYPGRALGLAVSKATREHRVTSYPNKSVCLRGSGFMFRSDSNSEDLVGFAGAGLFDSYPSKPTTEVPVEYGSADIARNGAWAHEVATKLLDIGLEIEQLYGEAQDIEGCIVGDTYYVVQTRPQV